MNWVYDGVAYKSGYGEMGFNVVLFDLASADLTNSCALYRIKDVSIRKEEEDRYFIECAG